jgi:dUTP pyrophosphatase
MSLTIKKLACNAIIPTRATSGSAGYDLYAYTSGEIKARSRMIVDTKITMFFPKNHCGLIWPRSGLSAKHGIETGAGVIDSDYTGEIKVILHNHSDVVFKYESGMRIAQILIQNVVELKEIDTPELKEIDTPELKEIDTPLNDLSRSVCVVDNSDTDDETTIHETFYERNSKGFGSSGLF